MPGRSRTPEGLVASWRRWAQRATDEGQALSLCYRVIVAMASRLDRGGHGDLAAEVRQVAADALEDVFELYAPRFLELQADGEIAALLLHSPGGEGGRSGAPRRIGVHRYTRNTFTRDTPRSA